jgi:hypothetical protein
VQENKLFTLLGKQSEIKIIETNGTSGLNFIVQMVLAAMKSCYWGASKLKDDVEIIPQAIASEDAQKS